MDHLTPGLLQITEAQWRLSGSLNSGGVSEDGENQTRRSDGGGQWIMTGEIILTTDDEVRAYEALLLGWSLGGDIIVVHRIAGPLALSATSTLVGFSDGSTFSDGTEFAGGDVYATLVDDVDAGQTSYRIRIASPRPLRGAEPLTLVGPVYKDRLHGVARILAAVADGDATVYTVLAAPPVREDYAAGTEVDFVRPRVVMRPDMSDPDVWPTYRDVFVGARVPISFRETRRMS